MHDVAVYLGPSLHPNKGGRVLDAEYLPPIKRGDLAKLPVEMKIVGIVDGEFFQSLAVSPREILPLLDRGVTVLGAASMGAMRAVEVESNGMIGIGEIFRMYRDGRIDGDDEVALIYESETYRNLSVPLVNIRHSLELAVGEGVITQGMASDILITLKGVYFPSRSYEQAIALAPRLKAFLHEKKPDLKRDDALQLLHRIAQLRSS
jgi:hypothetical protein